MAAQDLCSLSDVRQALELPATDTARDALISMLITVASDFIMDELEREFAPATASATRRFRFGGPQIDLAPYEVRSVVSITVHPEASSPIVIATTDYQLQPIPSQFGTFQFIQLSAWRPDLFISDTIWKFGYGLVDVNGAWGFATVPTAANRACIETVRAWLRADVSALELGDLVDQGRTLLPVDQFPLPNRAFKLLENFRRPAQQVWVV